MVTPTVLIQLKNNLNLLPKTHVGHLTEEHVPTLIKVLEIVNPKKIFEIGFNAGHSAMMWLTLSNAELISVDPGNNWVWTGSNEVKDAFGTRFRFYNTSSQDPELINELMRLNFIPDLTFVDGDHTYPVCCKDLQLAYNLGSKYIFVDNVEDGDNVGNALMHFLEDCPYEKVREDTIEETKQRLALLRRKNEEVKSNSKQ